MAGQVELKRYNDELCLARPPKLVIGGARVSGQAFMDNAEFRAFTYDTFKAGVLDMESAAVAQVAHLNNRPLRRLPQPVRSRGRRAGR